jgi:hypothetical protein
MHHHDRARKAASVRAFAAIAAKGETPVTRCRLIVTAHLPTARRFDPSNIAGTVAKHAIDGITDAEIWPDDDSEHVIAVTYQRGAKTGQAGMYRLAIEIEEVA